MQSVTRHVDDAARIPIEQQTCPALLASGVNPAGKRAIGMVIQLMRAQLNESDAMIECMFEAFQEFIYSPGIPARDHEQGRQAQCIDDGPIGHRKDAGIHDIRL